MNAVANDWRADGHDVRLQSDGQTVWLSANGGQIEMSRDDATALLGMLESWESGVME